MPKFYDKDASILRYAAASTKFTVLASASFLGAAASLWVKYRLSLINAAGMLLGSSVFTLISDLLDRFGSGLLSCGTVSLVIAIILRIFQSDADHIAHQVRKGLFCPDYGNPLAFRDGERLPAVECKSSGLGEYELSISATACTVEQLEKLASSISSALNKRKYRRYAVTQTISDVAFNMVTYRIEDVTIDKAVYVHDASELQPKDSTKLIIQKGASLDLILFFN